jgi:hypothetical protein
MGLKEGVEDRAAGKGKGRETAVREARGDELIAAAAASAAAAAAAFSWLR